MQTHYTVLILPIATPRPKVRVLNRNGRKVPQAYYPETYAVFKKVLAYLLNVQRISPGNYGKLSAVFFLPYPKKTAKKRLIEGTPHIKKPDADNFLKGLMDGLETAGIIKNDSGFYSIRVMKLYTIDTPRIQFTLS